MDEKTETHYAIQVHAGGRGIWKDKACVPDWDMVKERFHYVKTMYGTNHTMRVLKRTMILKAETVWNEGDPEI